ncbi:isochorismate synthase DhbC [Actinorhabdospora filicis]|uniref:isochorismate synthase n=1 Tax=Actinorhabdospora filicis TaxID=1785913 RepID=A0A9W6STM5_9ACTN|nr:isochorismate synthase [Actinorhabdospora filicis]GLZ81735.1 isochorismate synthase DhbC [Actinorhabdospora filicis]
MTLFDGYRPHSSFLYGTSERALHAKGATVTLPGRGPEAPARAAAVLRALGGDAIVVGAIPFADDEPARLVVPEHYRWGPPITGAAVPRVGATVRAEPTEEHYLSAVHKALSMMDGGGLAKTVLARSLVLRPNRPVDLPALLRGLAGRDPRGHTFAVPLPRRRVLAGASPELLVRRRGRVVTAHPLAGSRPRTGDGRDTAAVAELRASDKDHREHAHVVDAITAALAPYCSRLRVPEPEVTGTAAMWHLGTLITGELADPGTTALELACALHPTPAVCGTPTGAAREAITALEGFHRGFYAGMVGWTDAAGDGEWAVAIRCAEFAEGEIRLFAGAGIVPGSHPDRELAETTAKFTTLLAGLGLEDGDVRRVHHVA